MSDDKSDEEESSSNYYTGFTYNICLVVSNFRNEIEKHINTDYAVNGWMIFVIHQIILDVFKSSNRKHHIQVNTVIKTLFAGSSEKELYKILDIFWSECTKFSHKNDPFNSNEFI